MVQKLVKVCYFMISSKLPQFSSTVHSFIHSLPTWVVQASGFCPLLLLQCQLDIHWQCTATPICYVIRLCSCWSGLHEVDHLQPFPHHSLHQSIILQLCLNIFFVKYSVEQCPIFSLRTLLLTMLPSHFQQSPLASYLRSQEFSIVICL